MSIRKRPSSQFWQYRFKERGVPWSGTTKETDRGKALKFEAVLRSKVIRGEVRREMLDAPTLAVFSKDYLAYVDASDLSENTKRCYRNGWRLLSSKPVAKIPVSDIERSHARTLTFRGGPSNANQALRTLRNMLSYACEMKLRGEPPKIKLRQEQKREGVLTEAWQEDLLIGHAAGNLRDFLIVTLRGGPRPKETTSLKWKDIDWAKNQIRIAGTKSDAAKRHTIMTADCADALRERKRTSKSEWVFPSDSKSGHMLPTSFPRAFKVLKTKVASECKKQGLPTEWLDGLVPYSLRHTFGTNVQAATGDRAKTAKLMGHASMGILDRYTHPRSGDPAATMDAWEAERRKVVKMGRRA